MGSVFSPYYKRSGRARPDHHCALNVALYGPNKTRWAMTERGEASIARSSDHFRLSNSVLRWNGSTLTIDIDEVTAPIPRAIKGQVRVHTEGLGDTTFFIDDAGRHRWRPLSPMSHVEVDLQEPNLQWSGSGYLDTNHGDEPLEDAFAFWDWSRTMIGTDHTAILYNTDMQNGASRLSALLVDKKGAIEEIDAPADAHLPSTLLFRIPRRTRADDGPAPKVLKTLEDTPFYSRSLIETNIMGARRQAIHESLAGPRLNKGYTQFMLPFRMPRKP